jgi:hypothetical protein
MAKMVVIDARNKAVRLENSVCSKKIAQLLGAGPRDVYSLPNGDKLKINRNSPDQASFTIGHSSPFRGNAVVIAKTSVNVSNMALLVKAIRQMVTFEGNNYNSDAGAAQRVEQMDFWPPRSTDDGANVSTGR